jgi:hypothetical protein
VTDSSTAGDVYDSVALHDPQMLEEIELLGDLIVVASATPRKLSQAEIDTALGLAVPVVSALPVAVVPCL